jgi:hypothetical protein
MRGRGLAALVASAALLVAAVASASALAGGPGPDRSFGHAGHSPLTPVKPAGVKKLEYREWLGAADGSVYVLATSECRGCGDRGNYLFKFSRAGRFDASFGRHGYAALPPGEEGLRLAVDGHGRAIVSDGAKGVQVRRFTRGGHPDRSFGRDGVVELPKLHAFLTDAPTVSPMPGGGLLVALESSAEGHGFAHIVLAELDERGAPVRTFGRNGVTGVDAAGAFHVEYGPTPLPGGAVLIGSLSCCTEKVSLTRVSARGRLDTRYDRAARRALRPLAVLREHSEEGTELNAIIPRPDGGADLFGFVSPHGFEARVKADGEADTRFGRQGLKVLPLPVSTATAIRGGGFLLAGNEFNQQTVAYAIHGDGSVDRSFRPSPLGPGSFYPRATTLDDGHGSIAFGKMLEPEEDFQYRPLVARFDLPKGARR